MRHKYSQTQTIFKTIFKTQTQTILKTQTQTILKTISQNYFSK